MEIPIRIGLFYYFSKQVLYCCDRMIQYHTGSCIAHCIAYLLLHLWLVAVDRTLLSPELLPLNCSVLKDLCSMKTKQTIIWQRKM